MLPDMPPHMVMGRERDTPALRHIFPKPRIKSSLAIVTVSFLSLAPCVHLRISLHFSVLDAASRAARVRKVHPAPRLSSPRSMAGTQSGMFELEEGKGEHEERPMKPLSAPRGCGKHRQRAELANTEPMAQPPHQRTFSRHCRCIGDSELACRQAYMPIEEFHDSKPLALPQTVPLLCALVVVLLPSLAWAQHCPSPFTPVYLPTYGRHWCFHRHTNLVSRDSTQSYCQGIGGELAAFHSHAGAYASVAQIATWPHHPDFHCQAQT